MTRRQQGSGGLGQRRHGRDSARRGEMNPASPALIADVHGHEREKLSAVDAVVTVTDDRTSGGAAACR